jgi:hypothetical protein
MVHVDTNQGSIGTMNRNPPSADDHKKHEKVNLEAPNPSRRRINLIDPDGNESVESHSLNGTEPYGFISV